MRDFKVRILSAQKIQDGSSETIEFFTQAKGRQEGETLFLVYKESEISGLEGALTKLKISSDTMHLIRSGNIKQEVLFDPKQPCSFEYRTPYGTFFFQAQTLMIHTEQREGQFEFVELSYTLFDGMNEKFGEYQMQLFITRDEEIK